MFPHVHPQPTSLFSLFIAKKKSSLLFAFKSSSLSSINFILLLQELGIFNLSSTMGESKKVIFEDPCFDQFKINNLHVMAMEDEDDQLSSSIGEDDDSCTSSSSSDITDDASSDSSSNPSSYDLSDLMSQLPIKRGLSKFYQGKSQSYTSLSRVTSLEDLAKKQNPYRKKMMSSCKSYGGGLDTYKLHTLQKPIISKKSSPKGSFLISRKQSFGSFCRPPIVPVQEKM